MPNQIYKKGNFTITSNSDGFIVENTDFKESEQYSLHFQVGGRQKESTVLNNCKRLINSAIKKEVPRNCNKDFLDSLIRVTGDEKFKKKVKKCKAAKQHKSPRESYININKGGYRRNNGSYNF